MFEVCFGGFKCFTFRDEVIASKASFNGNDVGFRAEVCDFFAENNFCSSHGKRMRLLRGAGNRGVCPMSQAGFLEEIHYCELWWVG